ncbi:MAG: DUF2630 family protein [Nitrospira sp.]|nr:DUF2630 family protein [Nitrospira sp.]
MSARPDRTLSDKVSGTTGLISPVIKWVGASVDRKLVGAYDQTLFMPTTSGLEEVLVENHIEDQPVLTHIQRLVEEEHRLHELRAHPKADRKRLAQVRVELDQCWDLLRQRRALRDVGLDPNEAEIRPPEIVENYEQ